MGIKVMLPVFRKTISPAVFALIFLLFPIFANGQAEKGVQPTLNKQLINQITALKAEKQARTPAQKKIGSQLLYAVKERQGDPIMRQLPGMITAVEVEADDTTLVDIKAEVTPMLLEEIINLGGTVENAHPEYNAIRARLPLAALEPLAERGEVSRIGQAAKPFLRKVNTSEGDVAHAADKVRNKYSFTGKGIKVGVLSDSVDNLGYVQSLGDLPAVTVLDNAPGNSGEGTAMLEIIHDLAPDAELYFATAWKGNVSFANNIKALAAAGCQIILDDVGYLDEFPFQDDIISQAVNTVTSQGVLYFSSAGNAGNKSDGTAGVWEGDFRGFPVVLEGTVYTANDFGGGDLFNRITDDAGCYSLFWSDRLGASNNDYDLYLVDPTLTTIVAQSTGFQDGNDDPIEGFCVADGQDVTGYSLLVDLYQGQGMNRFLHLSANRGRLEHTTAGQISGHPAAENAFAVAAVNARGKTTPFAGTENVEWYTTDGPRRVFYEPNGTFITPGNLTSTGGRVRQKPDIAAADCVKTATPGFATFCGTSASVSHAAGIAALMLSGKPDLTVDEVRQAFANSALDIEGTGWDRNSGYGLLMAENVFKEIGPFARINTGFLHLLLLKK